MLRANRDVVVDRLDPIGLYPVLRFNHLQGPTTNLKLRQAMLAAVDAREVMQAVMGDDKAAYHAPVGVFVPGTLLDDFMVDLTEIRARLPVGEAVRDGQLTVREVIHGLESIFGRLRNAALGAD